MVELEHTQRIPALRGVQSGREFYLAMFPWKLVPRVFVFDEEEFVHPEWRAQRTLNKARIPEITRYLVENSKDYVLSALTASISSGVTFDPIGDDGNEKNVGVLSIPMDATILINDGQHRRAAIIEALKESSDLSSETIPVVFFVDAGLKRSQQMFADLNKHAVRPSLSLGVLYEHRDALSELARRVASEIPLFNRYTELEKTSISNRAAKLFTLSALYQSIRALLRKTKDDEVTADETELTLEFFDLLSKTIPEWVMIEEKTMKCSEARSGFVHSHAVALVAIGRAGGALLSEHPRGWKGRLKRLSQLDWSRANTELWEGRAIVQGRVSKAKRHVDLTVNVIKETLGLPLSPAEQRLEETYMSGGHVT